MKSRTLFTPLLICALMLAFYPPLRAEAARRAHSPAPAQSPAFDLSPVIVQPFSVSAETNPARKAWEQKMNLEDGVEVRGTRYITSQDVTSRDLFILQITQSLEGGFDSTNMYDRGLLSWGLMQWATHSGSLDGVLLYMKQRLSTMNGGQLWHKLFVDNGVDVDRQGILFYGKHPGSLAERRVDLRGSATPGKFDPNLVNHWATVMARAGRQPEIQKLEIEYADKVVDGVLDRQIPGVGFHAPGRGGVTPEDLAGSDPYAEALIFVIWTNNPSHAWQYIADSAKAAHSVAKDDDPSKWPSGTFSEALLRRCKGSHFGNWSARAAMIETRSLIVRSASPSDLTPFEQSYQVVLADRKQRHIVELASRHMEMQRNSTARGAAPPKTIKVAEALPRTSLPVSKPALTKPAAQAVKSVPVSVAPVAATGPDVASKPVLPAPPPADVVIPPNSLITVNQDPTAELPDFKIESLTATAGAAAN